MTARTAAALVLVTVVLLASVFVIVAVGMDLTPGYRHRRPTGRCPGYPRLLRLRALGAAHN